jgi:hypothetical protein
MNNKLNLTSLVLGAVIGALAIFTMGAANSSSTQTNVAGRFQLLAIDGLIFKIDSQTGQVWRGNVNGDIKSFGKPVVAE